MTQWGEYKSVVFFEQCCRLAKDSCYLKLRRLFQPYYPCKYRIPPQRIAVFLNRYSYREQDSYTDLEYHVSHVQNRGAVNKNKIAGSRLGENERTFLLDDSEEPHNDNRCQGHQKFQRKGLSTPLYLDTSIQEEWLDFHTVLDRT